MKVRQESFFTYFIVAILLMVVVTGCGPGSSGTGTGASEPSANLGSAAAGPLDLNLAVSTPFTATTISGRYGNSQTNVVLSTNRIEVTSNCLRFVFTGTWQTESSLFSASTGTLGDYKPGDLQNPTGTRVSTIFIGLAAANNLNFVITDQQGTQLFRAESLVPITTVNPLSCK
jgi:hypothetical protein